MAEGLYNPIAPDIYDRLDALGVSIPKPATMLPLGVEDVSSVGTDQSYALANHSHASKARKAIVNVGAVATYTWTYPVAFPAGVVPVCNAIAQVASGTTDLFNAQIIGTPTNTKCTFQINRVSSGLLSLLGGALSVNPTPAAITLHMTALEP